VANSKGGGRSLFVRGLGLVMIITSVVLGTYLLVAFVAWESGRSERAAAEASRSVEQIERQVALAEQDAGHGSYGLALDRVEWVLTQEPDNAAALTLRQRIVATEEAAGPGPAAAATELPAEPAPAEPTVESTAAPGREELRRELDALRRLDEREQWDELLSATLAFQQRFPNDERDETDKLLYNAYLNLGLETLKTEKVELGLNYLSQAERLGDLPQEAQDFRFWAELYLDAIAYYGVDWQIASANFRELCLSAPFYQNACNRLYDSLVSYGDQLAFLGDWCPAESVYQEAWSLGGTSDLGGKLDQARAGCLSATPEGLTDTVPITGAPPPEGGETIATATPGE